MSQRASELASEELAIPIPYYQYRLTRPHALCESFLELINKYSSDYCICLHNPDEMEEGCKKEHFHAVFRDFGKKEVDKFRLAMRAEPFNCKGNADHSGKMQANHISQAVGYFKHDPDVVIRHSGQAHWLHFIENVPAFEKKSTKQVFKRERLGHPALTYGNVLKQALKYHQEHSMRTTLLSEVVEEMVNESDWCPSRDLLANGIPREIHQMFSDRVQNKRIKLDFWLPHQPSEKKLEWKDRIADGWYPSGVSSSGCPGDSKKMYSGP